MTTDDTLWDLENASGQNTLTLRVTRLQRALSLSCHFQPIFVRAMRSEEEKTSPVSSV
ncbi:hypothetical protein N9X60_05420 [Paracoccaceae bacterium]|nr:hypothetical protein [Paracoccaceae bacterium]